MQSGFDINHLTREARIRWLKPIEVFFILQNYKEQQLTHHVPQKPAGGSLYLFNKRVLKFFRKDGHSWRRRKDQRTTAEAHERLKVGNVEALNCYYARGAEDPNFQRRSYWMLDPAYEHIVLVHYRDVHEGRQNAGSRYHFSALSSTLSQSPTSFDARQPDSSLLITESFDLYQSSPRSVEINSSHVMKNHEINQMDITQGIREDTTSSVLDLGQALRRIEQQLSLNDDKENEIATFHFENNDSNDLEEALCDHDLSGKSSNGPDSFPSQEFVGVHQHHQLPGADDDIWREMLNGFNNVPNVEPESQFGGQDDPSLIFGGVDSLDYHAYYPVTQDLGTAVDLDGSSFDQHFENITSLTIAQNQKFTIHDISPDWCFSSDGSKIIIIGSFLSDPLECAWTCMIGESEVPVQIVQEGVLCCHAPPHMPGKVNICITAGNRESCSEVWEFEYRANPNSCMRDNPSETEAYNSVEEQLLLVRFVKMLLSDRLPKREISKFRPELLGKSRLSEDPWSYIAEAIRDSTSTPLRTLDWLLQELLKDNLEVWLSYKLQQNNNITCSWSKEEQGVIHIVAGLGFEWALQPILSSGMSIDFRDTQGWTALHWAAQFGREKMVASLVASGASAGAVTHPNSQDPRGRTAASIAEASGHRGLAGYLSEVALTSHLSSLTLEESELSKGCAAVEAETRVNSLQEGSSTNEDQISLKHTLAAVRNATQAAARIQSAFRAHSFRKRKQREAAAVIRSISDASSKLVYCNARDSNSAALTIQKKYKGWKGRKDFLAFRQKVVKIQAHVRGYQVRKHYKICWAASILEKVILRWRRQGVGLRGFKVDPEFFDESVDDDEDILRVFRKQKVDAAIDEAVSMVLSMVESPEARQQYYRILQKYREAKAELETV